MVVICGRRSVVVVSVWIVLCMALWGSMKLTHPCALTDCRTFKALLSREDVHDGLCMVVGDGLEFGLHHGEQLWSDCSVGVK